MLDTKLSTREALTEATNAAANIAGTAAFPMGITTRSGLTIKPGTSLSKLPIGHKPTHSDVMPAGRWILVTGKPKMGKSASCIDARANLYMDFENRLEFLDVDRISPIYVPEGVDLSQHERPFCKILDQVARGGRFEFLLSWLDGVADAIRADGGNTVHTVTFDTIDTLAHHCAQAFAYDHGRTENFQKDYKDIYARLLPKIQQFRTLPVDTIFQCHVEEAGTGAESKVWLSTYPLIREWITSHADMILYLFQPDKDGLNRFYCWTHDGWPSGDGTGTLPETLPATMSAVYACFNGENPEQYQPQVKRWKTGEIPLALPPKGKRVKDKEIA